MATAFRQTQQSHLYTKIMSQQNVFGTVHGFVQKTALWLKGGFIPTKPSVWRRDDALSFLDVCEDVLTVKTSRDWTEGYYLMCITILMRNLCINTFSRVSRGARS